MHSRSHTLSLSLFVYVYALCLYIYVDSAEFVLSLCVDLQALHSRLLCPEWRRLIIVSGLSLHLLPLSVSVSLFRALSLWLSLSGARARALSLSLAVISSLPLSSSLSFSVYLSPSAGDCVSLLTRQFISISLHTSVSVLCAIIFVHIFSGWQGLVRYVGDSQEE